MFFCVCEGGKKEFSYVHKCQQVSANVVCVRLEVTTKRERERERETYTHNVREKRVVGITKR